MYNDNMFFMFVKFLITYIMVICCTQILYKNLKSLSNYSLLNIITINEYSIGIYNTVQCYMLFFKHLCSSLNGYFIV